MQKHRGHREMAGCFLGNLKCHQTVCSIPVSQFNPQRVHSSLGKSLVCGLVCSPLVDSGFGLETTTLRKHLQPWVRGMWGEAASEGFHLGTGVHPTFRSYYCR